MAAMGRCFKSFNRLVLVSGAISNHFDRRPGPYVIITCPNCQTRYKVASDALSAAGRQVQCAACTQLWYATPSFPAPQTPQRTLTPSVDEINFESDDDTLFGETDEHLLDAAFLDASPPFIPLEPNLVSPDAVAEAQPKPDAQARTEALAKRRKGMLAELPLARFRRFSRIAIALFLIVALAAAIGLRTEIVRLVPALDGLYRFVGLGTNIVGLDFTDVKTLRTTREGNSVLVVTAKISNTTNHVSFVPSVLVSLLDGGGEVVYEWTVTPSVRNLLPGDMLDIDARLTAPPDGVETVRLSFVAGQTSQSAPGTASP